MKNNWKDCNVYLKTIPHNLGAVKKKKEYKYVTGK